jgi:hypothetical protein
VASETEGADEELTESSPLPSVDDDAKVDNDIDDDNLDIDHDDAEIDDDVDDENLDANHDDNASLYLHNIKNILSMTGLCRVHWWQRSCTW